MACLAFNNISCSTPMYPTVSQTAHVPYSAYFIYLPDLPHSEGSHTVYCLLSVACHLLFAIHCSGCSVFIGHRHHLALAVLCTQYVITVLYHTSSKLILNLPVVQFTVCLNSFQGSYSHPVVQLDTYIISLVLQFLP